MRRRRPFLQEMTAFSEKMIVAARLMVTMITIMTMLTMITMWLMTMMTESPLGSWQLCKDYPCHASLTINPVKICETVTIYWNWKVKSKVKICDLAVNKLTFIYLNESFGQNPGPNIRMTTSFVAPLLNLSNDWIVRSGHFCDRLSNQVW